MIKYKTAQQIFDSVAEDFHVYDDQGLIDYSTLIKIIRTCNSDLSLKINDESEELISIQNYSGKLPDNFEALDFALACHRETIDVTPAKGFQIEYQGSLKTKPCSVCLEPCGPDFKVIQRCDKEYVQFDHLDVVRIVNTSVRKIKKDCINFHSRSRNEIKIEGDYVKTNFETGNIYIKYITNMSNEDGNLLVLDHPMVNAYYEWACKKQILINLLFNNDDDVVNKIKFAQFEYDKARAVAKGFVNTEEYDEIMRVLQDNRRRFHHKYVRPFDATF